MTRPTKRTDSSGSRSSPVIAIAVGVFLLAAVGVLLWRMLTAPAGGETPAASGGTAAGDLVVRPPTASPTAQPLTLGIAHTNDTWGYLFPCG